MRLSCMAVMAMLFGLIALENPSPAPGQHPPATTTAPVAQAVPSLAATGYWTPQAAGVFGQNSNLYTATHSSSPKEVEFERLARELVRQYGKTENRDEREKLKDKLNDTLKQAFDAQQQRRKDEVKKIEEELKKLRDLVDKRESSKSTIISRRLETLLQEADGLGWGATGADPFTSFPHAQYPATPAPSPAANTIRR